MVLGMTKLMALIGVNLTISIQHGGLFLMLVYNWENIAFHPVIPGPMCLIIILPESKVSMPTETWRGNLIG
ncbi:hypothetical protein D3C81_921200 [compost metagenome]